MDILYNDFYKHKPGSSWQQMEQEYFRIIEYNTV
jgi:hypothetical protein